jgi:hypothetical protein
MGAGRKAAKGILEFLGVRFAREAYAADGQSFSDRIFGVDPGERNFVRVRAS